MCFHIPLKAITGVVAPIWSEWADSYSHPTVEPEGISGCGNACGDIAFKSRNRNCSVEDLCIGTNTEYKRCNRKTAPEVCERQHGECDADGFR